MNQTISRGGKFMFKKLITVLLTCCLVFSLAACSSGGSSDVADMVITNAAVYTVDKDNTIAEAVAVKDGMIVYVGDSAGVEKFTGSSTKVVDLKGGAVMPGMVDSHMHPAMSATSYLFEILLSDCVGKESYLTEIAKFIKEKPDLEVYAGSGFMRSAFDTVGPRKEWLDKLETEKPVLIMSVDGHSMWVNSKALELAGITKDTKDPEGGVIQRDPATGEPSGLLQESAMQLVANLKPEYTKDQYKEAILWLQDWFNSVGLTTVFDAMVDLDNPDYYGAYQELAEAGKLTVRVRGGWHMYPEMGKENFDKYIEKGVKLSKNFTTPYFQVNAFKFFSDQVVEESSAYMSEPYSDRTDGWRGIKVWDDAVLADLFTKIDAKGFQLHIHQIGDAAATYTLDAIEKAVKANGKRDSRHSFAHVQFLNDKDMQRMADLKMNAIIAPYWMAMDDYYWEIYKPVLGEERVNNMYPAQSLLDKGVNTAVHSDFFVTEPDPGWLFYGAITRTLPKKMADAWYEGMDITRTTDINHPMEDYLIGPLPPYDERLTLEETVKAATYNGAYANFMEKEIGSIEVGKMADLMLFSEPIFDLDTEDLSNVLPTMTIFDGKIVYNEKE
jgi:predicted amidohydrolase YtcJ